MANPNEQLDDYGIEFDKVLDKSANYAYGETKGVLNYQPSFLNDGKTVQHSLLFDDVKKYLSDKGYTENVPTFSPDNNSEYKPTTFEIGDGSLNSRTFQYYRNLLEEEGDMIPKFANLTESHKKRIIDQEAIGLAGLQTYIMDNMPEGIDKDDKEAVYQYQDAYLSQILVPTITDSFKQYADTHSRHMSSAYVRQGLARSFAAVAKTIGSAYEDLTPFQDGADGENWMTKVSDSLNEYAKRPDLQGTGMFSLTDSEVKAEHGNILTIPIIDADIPTLKENYLFHKVAESIAQNPTSVATFIGTMRGAGKGTGTRGRLSGALKGGLQFGVPGFLVETGFFQEEFEENYFAMREKARMLKNSMPPDEFEKQFGIEIDDGTIITIDRLEDPQIRDMAGKIAREYGLYSTAMEIGSSVAYGMGTVAFQTGTGLVTSKYLKSKAGQQAMANEWFKKIGKKLKGSFGLMATNAVQEGLTERMQENLNIHMAENGGMLLTKQARIGNYGRITEKQKRDRLSSATFGGIAMGGVFEGSRQLYNFGRGLRGPNAQDSFDEVAQESKRNYDELVTTIREEIDQATKDKKPYANVVDQAVILRSLKNVDMDHNYKSIMDALSEDKTVQSAYPEGVDEEVIDAVFQQRNLDGTLQNKKKQLAVLKNTDPQLLNKLDIDSKDLIRLGYSNSEIKAVLPNFIPPKETVKSKTNFTSKTNIPTKNEGKINQSNAVIDRDIAEVSQSLNNMLKIKKMTASQKKMYDNLKERLNRLKKQRTTRNNVQGNKIKTPDNKFIAPRKDGEDPFMIVRLNIDSLSDHSLKKTMEGLPSDDKKDNLNYGFRVVGVSQSVNPLTNKKEKVYNIVPNPDAKKLFNIKNDQTFQVHESSLRIALDSKSQRYKVQEGKQAPIVKNPVAEKLNMPQPKGIRMQIANSKQGLKEVLDFVEVNSKENKALAGILKKSLGNTIGIKFDGKLKYQGLFTRSKNLISLNPRGKDDAMLERVVMHEAVHAATSNKIKAYQDGNLNKGSKAYKSIAQLDKIYNTLLNGLTKDDAKSLADLEKLYGEIKGGKITKDDITDLQKLLRDEFYGFTNLSEFTAELLTNKTFQQKLEGIKYKNTNKSLLDAFKQIIAKVFGVEKGDNALYNSLVFAMEAIDSPQPKIKKDETKVETKLDKKGRTLTYFATTKDKGEVKHTTYTFNRSDKKESQRNKSGVSPETAFGNKYEIKKGKLDEFNTEKGDNWVVDKVFEVREGEGAFADVTLINKATGDKLTDISLILKKINRTSPRPSAEAIAEKEAFDKKLSKMKLPRLRDIAKERGIKGFSKMQKAKLIQAIKALPPTKTVEEVFNFGDKKETPIVLERQSTVDKKSYLPPKLLNVINDARDILKKYKKGKKLKSSDANYISGLLKDEYGNTKEYEDSKGRRSKKIIIDNFKHQSKEFRKFFPNIGKEPEDDGLGVSSGISVRDIEQAVKEYENRIKKDDDKKETTAPKTFLEKIGQADLNAETITEDVITTSAQNVVDETTKNLGEDPLPGQQIDEKDQIDEQIDMSGWKNDKVDDREYSIFEGLGFNKGRLQRNDQKRANTAFESIWLELRDKYEIDEMFWSNWKGMMEQKLKGTIYHKHFKEWSDAYQVGLVGAKDDIGVNSEQEFHLFNPEDLKNDEFFSSHNINRLVDAGKWVEETVRQGLSINENKLEASTNTKNSGKIENAFFRLIDLIPTTKQNLAIGEAINEAESFDEFISIVSSDKFVSKNGLFLAGNKRVRDFLEYDPDDVVRSKMLRFYLSGLAINRTPTNRGRSHKGAIRTLFGLYTGNIMNDKEPEYKIRFMNHRNRIINRYNTPNRMRTRAIERSGQFNPEDLMYLSLNDLYRWTKNDNPNSKYKVKTVKQENFKIKENEIHTLSRSMLQKGMVPLMIRGDSDLIPVAKITKDIMMSAYKPENYWAKEMEGFSNEEMQEFGNNWGNDFLIDKDSMSNEELQLLTGDTGKRGINRLNAGNITRHESYKKMYGEKYWKYMNGHKMYTRSKLVFSQGTVNPDMPKQTAVVFDPKIELGEKSKAKIVHIKKNGDEAELPLVIFTAGQWQYKLDGKLLTSESVHREIYPKYLGTNKKATRAKTSFYQRGETGAIAFKHQEMTFHTRPDVERSEIYDGDGIHVATIKKDSRGYNQIYKEGENAGEISYLGTPEENKFATGEYANDETRKPNFNEVIVLNPEAINLIMYPRDYDKSYGKMMPQLMNYHSDPEAQKAVMEMFEDSDPKKKFTPKSLLNTFKNIMGDYQELSNYMKKWVNIEIDNLPVAFAQNASLDAGFHPTQSGMNKNVIRNSILEGVKDFNTYGSTLDVNMDVFGDIERENTIIPYDHKIAKNIFNIMRAYKKSTRKDFDLDEVNAWLSTLKKPIEVLAIRSPVPKKFGYAVLKVKELQNIGDTIVMHDDVVKNDLEADGDGDKVTVVMANNENKKFVKMMADRHQSPPVLVYEKNSNNQNIASQLEANNLTASMIQGQGAIGQIASITRTTGILKTWFKSITIAEEGVEPVTIVMRDLDKEMLYDHGRKEKSTIADHYYSYLQAAFDHGQFLLLDKWGYDRKRLYEMAFKYSNESTEPESFMGEGGGIIRPEHLEIVIETLLMPTAKVGQLMNGYQNGKKMSFAEELEMSREYMDYVNARNNLSGELVINPEGETAAYFISGSNEINSIHEKIATKFSTFIDENRININIFDMDPEMSRNINIKTMRLMIDDLIEGGNEMAILEEGFTTDDFEKLPVDQKRNIMRNANSKIQKAHKYANDFKAEIMSKYTKMENRNKQDLESGEDLAFDVNKWSFDPVMRNVYEKWMEKTNNFSDLERYHFTIKFLFDTANPTKGYKQRDIRLIPPATRLGPSLLDPDILQDYYQNYNEIAKKYDETIVKENDWMEPLMQQVKYEWEKAGCMG